MSGNSPNSNVEVEIALLCGVLGFFIGGLINFNKEIIDIFMAAVISGVTVFIVSYYVMVLISGGKKPGLPAGDGVNKAGFSEQKFRVVSGDADKDKGKKLDITAKDDDLFDDIFGK